MRKLNLVLENIRDEYMMNILEEGSVTELGALKTKKFLNENLGRIRGMLVEEGTMDKVKDHLSKNWGNYLAGAGAAGTVGLLNHYLNGEGNVTSAGMLNDLGKGDLGGAWNHLADGVSAKWDGIHNHDEDAGFGTNPVSELARKLALLGVDDPAKATVPGLAQVAPLVQTDAPSPYSQEAVGNQGLDFARKYVGQPNIIPGQAGINAARAGLVKAMS